MRRAFFALDDCSLLDGETLPIFPSFAFAFAFAFVPVPVSGIYGIIFAMTYDGLMNDDP